MPKKVIVVGAGVGGIATAARLAHAGLEVEVYEKNDFSGGRCSLIHHDGYRFDQVSCSPGPSHACAFDNLLTLRGSSSWQGPSLFLLPPLFHQLYNDLGESLNDHIDLIQCDPNYVIHYHDGETVTLSSNRAALAREIERFEGRKGVEALDGFLK
jgi:phytoene desaturase (3,4-didehydrolycopene-forming)